MQRPDRESEHLDPRRQVVRVLEFVFTSWTVTRTFLLSAHPPSPPPPYTVDKNLALGLFTGYFNALFRPKQGVVK